MKTTSYNTWIDFIQSQYPGFQVIKPSSADGNPLVWIQAGEQRVRILQVPDSHFTFWIGRYEDAEGKQGDELVVDVNTQADNVRLAQNVVEAFLKRGV
jgi:hypothetical protein